MHLTFQNPNPSYDLTPSLTGESSASMVPTQLDDPVDSQRLHAIPNDISPINPKPLQGREIAILEWSTDYQGLTSRYGKLRNQAGMIIAFVKQVLPKEAIIKQIQNNSGNLHPDFLEKEVSKTMELYRIKNTAEQNFLKENSTRFSFIVNETSKEILARYQIQLIDPNNPNESPVVIPQVILNNLIIEEFGEMDLFEKIIRNSCDIEVILNYTHALLKCLSTLEKQNFCHNDLKPENIIVIQDQLKLVDWGDFLLLNPQGFVFNNLSTFNVGTNAYAAPESIYAKTTGHSVPFDKKDVWSLGIILVLILSKRYIIPNTSIKKIYQWIAENNQPASPDNRRNIKEYIHQKMKFKIKSFLHKHKDLFKKLPPKTPSKSLDFLPLIRALLLVPYETRISASEALVQFETEILSQIKDNSLLVA